VAKVSDSVNSKILYIIGHAVHTLAKAVPSQQGYEAPRHVSAVSTPSVWRGRDFLGRSFHEVRGCALRDVPDEDIDMTVSSFPRVHFIDAVRQRFPHVYPLRLHTSPLSNRYIPIAF